MDRNHSELMRVRLALRDHVMLPVIAAMSDLSEPACLAQLQRLARGGHAREWAPGCWEALA